MGERVQSNVGQRTPAGEGARGGRRSGKEGVRGGGKAGEWRRNGVMELGSVGRMTRERGSAVGHRQANGPRTGFGNGARVNEMLGRGATGGELRAIGDE